MPRLADGFVGELKDRIDLFDIVSRYVQLKKSGSSWVGLSPFNKEKTPSFYVHPQKGFFNCFSSGEKGDGITFIQKIENLDFYEAVEYLSREFNIPLRFQEGTSSLQPLGQSLRKELYALQEMVKDWFHEQFNGNDKESETARDYWVNERKFTQETAIQFGVGYAPVDRFALGKFLRKKLIPDHILAKSGLFYERKNQSDWVSIFCGRLMIPIREKLGRICGFTGRKLSVTPEWGDKKAPKYVNSPETPIFLKGQLLFNLDLANKAINEQKDFLLVEGQLDAIRCHTEGFHTTVA
ncbi:MAG: DNA primase, partial [Verrucomicrobia bacterium]|nr:DNA primase [Verrucomicrobiota bacterium]